MFAREHVIQTPDGARVLEEMGFGFAVLRPAFAPGDSSKADQRLNLGGQATDRRIARSVDGVFITNRHLWAILIDLTKAGQSLCLDDASRSLFWTAPDLHSRLMHLFAAHDATDTYWRLMVTLGWYEPQTRVVHRRAA